MENALATHGPIVMDAEELEKVQEKLRENPHDYIALCAEGVLYFNDDFDKAITCFSKALAIEPFDSNQYYNRRRKFLSQDRYPQAISDLTMATRLDT